tara:strand:+ start:652 stop:801 length:150 start_codon:yes stop_codon:yes gene_type:complete
MGKVININGKDIAMSGRARDPENVDFLVKFINMLIKERKAKDDKNNINL